MKVLVTAGGTTESIDGVRFIKNTSTGKTGVLIAGCFYKAGFDVELLKAEGVESPDNIPAKTFSDYQSLSQYFDSDYLKKFDLVIHSAAVSDFKVSHISADGKALSMDQKISSGEDIQIHLKPTAKLINRIKELNPKAVLIGFKLTNTNIEDEQVAAVVKLFKNSFADYVVFNDLNKKTDNKHEFTIYNPQLKELQQGSTSAELAHSLVKIGKELKDVSMSGCG